MFAFRPGPTVSRSVSSSTASVSLGTQANVVRVLNPLSETVWVKFGTDSATAATTDTPVLAASTDVFYVGKANYVAAITASGTGTVYFTIGEGY